MFFGYVITKIFSNIHSDITATEQHYIIKICWFPAYMLACTRLPHNNMSPYLPVCAVCVSASPRI